jgi:lauroyl/myristoyl acyltransferase
MNNKKVPRVRWHKKLRYWFEWLGVALSVRIIPLVPLALLRLLADLAGWLAFGLDRKGRAVALANLQAAFGEERNLSDRKRIARRSLQLFGRSFLELFWSARLNANNVDRFLYFEDESAVKARCSNQVNACANLPDHSLQQFRVGERLVCSPWLPWLRTDTAL